MKTHLIYNNTFKVKQHLKQDNEKTICATSENKEKKNMHLFFKI